MDSDRPVPSTDSGTGHPAASGLRKTTRESRRQRERFRKRDCDGIIASSGVKLWPGDAVRDQEKWWRKAATILGSLRAVQFGGCVGLSADALYGLYRDTHGLSVHEIDYEPIASGAAGRLDAWRQTLRDMGFLNERPDISSRMLELAVAWAVKRGSATELILGLFQLFGESSAAPTQMQKYYLRNLWIAVRVNKAAHDAFDCLGSPSHEATRLQALLLLHFVDDVQLYSRNDVLTLEHTLRGVRGEYTVWMVFGGGPHLNFWEYRDLDPEGWAVVLKESVEYAQKRRARKLDEVLGIPAEELPKALEALRSLRAENK